MIISVGRLRIADDTSSVGADDHFFYITARLQLVPRDERGDAIEVSREKKKERNLSNKLFSRDARHAREIYSRVR